MSQSQLPLLIGIGSRIRKSPYYESDLKYGVTGFTVYNKMYLPTGFSGPEKEYESLINDVTFGDFAAERQIEISGPDAYDFIRYVQPRNLEKCEIGFCKYILLTDMNGGIINDACLLRLEENRFWISPGDGDVILWLQGIAINSGMDVSIREPDVSPLQISGPKSGKLIQKLFNGEHDDLGYYKARQTLLEEIPMVIARTGWSGELSYELYLQDGKLGNKLFELVYKAAQEFKGRVIAPNTIRTIEGGILSYDSNIDTGGFGVRYFGIGAHEEFRVDQVTVSMRVVAVQTGEVVLAVNGTKTIASHKSGVDAFRFIDMGTRAIEVESGAAENEPVNYAIRSAVEYCIIEIIKQGEQKSLWNFKEEINEPNEGIH